MFFYYISKVIKSCEIIHEDFNDVEIQLLPGVPQDSRLRSFVFITAII